VLTANQTRPPPTSAPPSSGTRAKPRPHSRPSHKACSPSSSGSACTSRGVYARCVVATL